MIQPTTAPPTKSLTNLVSTEKQGILGETVRGAGQGASPWKSVKFEEELPEGFPERTANASRRRVARQSELSGTRLVILWLSRVFHILTRRIAQSLTGGARDEF